MPKKVKKNEDANKDESVKKETKAKKVKKDAAATEVPAKIDPQKAFKMAAAAVDKKFPKAFHAWLHEDDKLIQRRFSSGSISLDTAMDGKGLPHGRIIEVWGPSGGGKTSWALETAWHLQRQTGLGVVFMDLERKFDPSLLNKWQGGFLPNMTRLEMPESGEDAFATLLYYLESEGTGIVIMDSVSAIRSSKVLEADDQETYFGASAKLIGEWLPKISSASARTGVPILFVNQVRAKLDAGKKARGRAKLRKYGGMAYDHWVCVSLFLGRIGAPLNDGARDYAQWSKMVVYKNHSCDTKFKEWNLLLNYGTGFDNVAELVDRASSIGIISTNGSWLTLGDIQVQGKAAMLDAVRQAPDAQKYLWDEVKRMQLLSQTAPVTSDESYAAPGSWTDAEEDGVEVTIDGVEFD
jgi:recombination protein RecA